jgi:glucose/arabinose dehydrogenase
VRRVVIAITTCAALAACSGSSHKLTVRPSPTTVAGSSTTKSKPDTTTTVKHRKQAAAKKKPASTKTTIAAPLTFPPATTPLTFPPAPVTPAPALPTRPGTNLAAVKLALFPVASGLNSPVALAYRHGDTRMYVAEQSGRVRVVSGGHIVGTALTLSVSGGNEQGLLGIAFSPDGTKMYVDYTDANGDTRVAEYTMNGMIAVTSSRRQLLFQDQPYDNHNGGEVLVDSAGMLYIGFGDGGSGGDPQGNGQNRNTWLGKILRIDPHPHGGSPYTVPSTNPFVGQAGRKPEVWMYGLRNPWRFSLDRSTGDMWIGDVGQNAYEEIDYASAGMRGVNWGWNAREGFHAYSGGSAPGARNPLLEETHSNGWCAIIGGYVYRGHSVPNLYGVYLYADNCRTPIIGAVRSGGSVAARRSFSLGVSALTTFGEDASGELYAASRNGSVYKFVRG